MTAEGLITSFSNLSTDVGSLTTEVSTVKQTASSLSATVTQVQNTANSASSTASSAYTKAQSVELTVDGFTVTNAQGQTKIDGGQISADSVISASLESVGSGTIIVIEEGTLDILDANPIPWRSTYAQIGYFQYDEKVHFSTSYGTPLKIESRDDLSIDSNGTIFIGTNTANSGNVSIGQDGGNVNLIGNVKVNGSPISSGGGSAVATFG